MRPIKMLLALAIGLVTLCACTTSPTLPTETPAPSSAPATEEASPSPAPTEEETAPPSSPTSPPTETSTPPSTIQPTETPALDVVKTSVIIQEGNNLLKIRLHPRQSQELDDNYIGTDLGSYDPGYRDQKVVYPIGFKWIRISFNVDPLNWQYTQIQPGEYLIDPAVDDLVTEYSKNAVNIVLNLGVGTGENRPDTTRFKAKTDFDDYNNFVRFMVRHFKDRIRYYEIWNEPDTDTPWGGIGMNQYSNLIKQVVPVIRQEYPEAKIVIGATGGYHVKNFPGYGAALRYTLHIEYLTDLIKSGVAPVGRCHILAPVLLHQAGRCLLGRLSTDSGGNKGISDCRGFRGRIPG
jgi:hypothetical protein